MESHAIRLEAIYGRLIVSNSSPPSRYTDLVIVELTEHNPNVRFELGVRIAEEKPVVLMKAEGTGPLFDIDNMLRWIVPLKFCK